MAKRNRSPLDDTWNPHEHFARRVGVTLATALDLIERGTPDHLRMALIVLDSTTELVVRRNARENAMFFQFGRLVMQANAAALAGGEVAEEDLMPVYEVRFPLNALKDDLPDRTMVHLSKQAIRGLYSFGNNVDLAAFFGAIDAPTARALHDAHHYRNEAYHHDVMDSEAVAAIVEVQRVALADLLRGTRRTISDPLNNSPEDDALCAELGIATLTLSSLASRLDRVPSLVDVSATLSRVLGRRLDGLEHMLDEISRMFHGTGTTPHDAMRLAQLDEPWPLLDDVRRRTVPVPPTRLSEWRAKSQTLAAAGDRADALARYKDVDDTLQPLVEDVTALLLRADRAFDMAQEEQRGR